MSRIAEIVEWCRQNPPPPPETYVYVIGEGNGLVKIGVSNNPSRRLSNIKTNSGKPRLRVLKSWGCGDRAKRIERRAHTMLIKQNIHGEWFCMREDQAIAVVEDAILADSGFEHRMSPACGKIDTV